MKSQPSNSLPRYLVGSGWSKPSIEVVLNALGKPKVSVTTSGRQVAAAGLSPLEAARLLVAALLPFTE